jgi:hypothetical protein
VIEAALRTILAHPKNPESFAHAKRVLDYHDAHPQHQGATSMSLEQVIQENTAAIHALIAAMGFKGMSQSDIGTAAPAAVTLQAKVEKAVADKGIAGAKEEVKALVAAETKAEEPAVEPLDYEKVVKPAALGLANKKGRDALITVLTTFSCTTVKDAKPEQYGALLDALNAAASA